MPDPTDPDDSPLIRHVLYTNEVSGLLSSMIAALMCRARPERIKKALEGILENWDFHVEQAKGLAEAVAAHKGEPSGWEDPPPESNAN